MALDSRAAVRKDSSIWSLISQLAALYGGERFQVVDHWDADLYAIGIVGLKGDRRLVYVSTFKKPHGVYVYDCEDADGGSVERSEGVELQDLLLVLKRHLGLSARGPTSDAPFAARGARHSTASRGHMPGERDPLRSAFKRDQLTGEIRPLFNRASYSSRSQL
jgi:hypothetical protein